ncbi:MAG: nickel pincer cofactor biosynthesis protein LarB [Actinobacteria bacterium]|nr:nickel pincer cofactor biosynthesis protein LarB [Actinomycetota bacterium]
MNKEINNLISKLLDIYKEGKLSREDFLLKLREIYFEDIVFAKIDHHRSLRKGFPEVIFGQNKSPAQILEIAKRILKYSNILLITRINKEVFNYIKKEIPQVVFNKEAGIIYIPLEKDEKKLKTGITVICAGTSDIPVAEEAAVTAYLMGNNVRKIYDVGIAGIHRLLGYRDELLSSNVIVAVAGMEGALPGVVSSMVSCVVIGVPTSVGYGASFSGLSQLLTMLNSCSPGILVVNIDNGFGAGYAAGLINTRFSK